MITLLKINPNPSTCLPEYSTPLEKQRSERDRGVRETEKRERQRNVRDRGARETEEQERQRSEREKGARET